MQRSARWSRIKGLSGLTNAFPAIFPGYIPDDVQGTGPQDLRMPPALKQMALLSACVQTAGAWRRRAWITYDDYRVIEPISTPLERVGCGNRAGFHRFNFRSISRRSPGK